MRRNTLLTLAALVLVTTGLVAAAGPGRGTCAECPVGGPGFGPPDGAMAGAFAEHRAERIAAHLDLTAEQQSAWKTLRDELRATVEPLIEQMRDQRMQIHEMLAAGTTDAQALGELMLASHRLGEQIHQAHEANQEAFRALLTTEQLATYDELLAARGSDRGPGHHGPGHRGPGHRGPGSGGPGFGS